MPRKRDDDAHAATRDRLIDAGLRMFRSKSFDGVGISDILTAASTPKGSFYHYFTNKDDFGLAVADAYHVEQMAMASQILDSVTSSAFENLRVFFDAVIEDFVARDFLDGCLMCNLSNELADQKDAFHKRLSKQWSELTQLIADRLDRDCIERIGFAHLSANESADQLMNSWSGALTRMKAQRSDAALKLFIKTHFERGN